MHRILIAIFILLFIHKFIFCQNNFVRYFDINTQIIDNNFSTNNNTLSLDFLNYEAYFFGENHKSEKVSHKEIYLIKRLQKKIKNIFIEYPIGFNNTVKEYLNRPPTDTTKKDFEYYSGGNRNQEIILREIYSINQNNPDSQKLNLFHIDMNDANNVNIDDLLWFYKKKIKPKQIKKSYNYLKKIKKYNISDEDSLAKIYKMFGEVLYKNIPTYQSYFGKYFKEIRKDIDGINTYFIARKEDTICACKSNSREEFMLKNITEQINLDSNKSFISINGVFHIPLTIQYDWEYLDRWESLAHKFKTNNTDMKVCSVYFMDTEIDNFADVYFPTEKKLIIENTKRGETYLIRLDGENTPFKELSEKFQYIVVW